MLAEVFVEQEDGPGAGATRWPVSWATPTLPGQITTVDDLDLAHGPDHGRCWPWLAARAGEVGHYGVGDGADAAAPAPEHGRADGGQ